MGVTLATGDTHGAREADLSEADLGLLKDCADADPDGSKAGPMAEQMPQVFFLVVLLEK